MNTFRARIRLFFPPPVLLVLFLLFDVLTSWPAIMQWRRFITLPLTSCAAAVIGGLSLCLIITGLLQLISRNTTINALQPDKTKTLVIEGCYKFSRNPVYLGFVGMHLSAATGLSSVVGLLVTPLLVMLITTLHIQFEETEMARLFGQQWNAYSRKTPRWLWR
ncbi:putative protein-S-isoprenylcysteine methyltransferase [Trabulsiella guamensis ATCC 49490]|uniref:Isoprenylcysteine carboxylmethyltransferase family protein n=1 Tax=Trabulsiella guamensis ATCC 49490 TaxID=1005994 RepID=A0A085AJZ3_9ENTR|nr:isoprenylcysteine carboxylmethyltransferase family protein [Trabulsiella guamensis]KFC10538.1 putative protein-S-isoprenylcysteine methyltransferase [Trabulsiella guamensis ATCC 49490]